MTRLRTVVVTGASGNIGTALLKRLRRDRPDLEVRAVCRRPPEPGPPYDTACWTPVDLGRPGAAAALCPVFDGADAVVHLAWAIQPVRRRDLLSRVNVGGTAAVAEAAAATDSAVPSGSAARLTAPGSRVSSGRAPCASPRRTLPVPPPAARAAVAALFATRAIPTSPGWFDLALRSPLLDCARAERELGWRPSQASSATAGDLLDGLGRQDAGPSPALAGRNRA